MDECNANHVFRPTGEIAFPDEYHGLFTDDLTTIPEGSTLFNVYAYNAPVELGGQEELIGKSHFFIASFIFPYDPSYPSVGLLVGYLVGWLVRQSVIIS